MGLTTNDHRSATIQAAAHGAGVAVGLFPLSNSWVRNKRLVTPLPFRQSGLFYQLVYRPEDKNREELAQLRAWLVARVESLSG